MSSSNSQGYSKNYNFLRSFHLSFWDVLTGLPAGVLIFMGTILFSTLASLLGKLPEIVPLVILAIVSFLVGLLAGITRLRQGPATALSAGLIAAGILGYLWLAAQPGEVINTIVFGPVGIFTTIIISPLGGWQGAKFRKAL